MPSSSQAQQQPCTLFDTTIYDLRHMKCKQQNTAASGREFMCEKSLSNGNLARENFMNKSNQSLGSYNATSSDHIIDANTMTRSLRYQYGKHSKVAESTHVGCEQQRINYLKNLLLAEKHTPGAYGLKSSDYWTDNSRVKFASSIDSVQRLNGDVLFQDGGCFVDIGLIPPPPRPLNRKPIRSDSVSSAFHKNQDQQSQHQQQQPHKMSQIKFTTPCSKTTLVLNCVNNNNNNNNNNNHTDNNISRLISDNTINDIKLLNNNNSHITNNNNTKSMSSNTIMINKQNIDTKMHYSKNKIMSACTHGHEQPYISSQPQQQLIPQTLLSTSTNNTTTSSTNKIHQQHKNIMQNYDTISSTNNNVSDNYNSNNQFPAKYNTIGSSKYYHNNTTFNNKSQAPSSFSNINTNNTCNNSNQKTFIHKSAINNFLNSNNGRYFSSSLTNFNNYPSLMHHYNNTYHNCVDDDDDDDNDDDNNDDNDIINNFTTNHTTTAAGINGNNITDNNDNDDDYDDDDDDDEHDDDGHAPCSPYMEFKNDDIDNGSILDDAYESNLSMNHHHHSHHHPAASSIGGGITNMDAMHQQQFSHHIPWRHRQCPSSIGSSSSGTSFTKWDVSRHWLAVTSILLIAGAAAVAVPLALRVAAEAPFEERLQVAQQLLTTVPLIDGHNDLPWNIRKFVHNQLNEFQFDVNLKTVPPWSKSHWSHTDLIRLRKGQVSAQFWAAYVPCEAQYRDAVQLTLEQIDVIIRLTEKYAPQLITCTSAIDILEAHKNHQLCSLTGVEGGHSLGGSLSVLRTFYTLGVRYMTLTSTCHTPWADSSYADAPKYEVKHGGLTEFGKTIIREMNRLGMIVDLSHVSVGTMRDALEVSEAPVIFSHSSVYELCNSSRNVQDNILQLLVKNRGLVMINFYSKFLSCSENATVENAVAHINHVRSVAGIDHVGLGAGFDGINFTPKGLEDVSTYPVLFAELLGNGWTMDELTKLAGQNFLRVLEEVEMVRDKKRDEGTKPYEAQLNFRIEDPYNCTSS